jgi:hypothetical protein
MLSVRMLGVFTISMNDQRLVNDLGLSERLLASYLFEFAGRLQRRERLAELFWGHLDPEGARAALNTATWRLRKVVAADPAGKHSGNLRTLGTEVILDPAPWLRIDTHRLVLTVKQAFASAPFDMTSRLHLLEEAVDSYGGPFWILEEREHLHSLFARAASELLRAIRGRHCDRTTSFGLGSIARVDRPKYATASRAERAAGRGFAFPRALGKIISSRAGYRSDARDGATSHEIRSGDLFNKLDTVKQGVFSGRASQPSLGEGAGFCQS